MKEKNLEKNLNQKNRKKKWGNLFLNLVIVILSIAYVPLMIRIYVIHTIEEEEKGLDMHAIMYDLEKGRYDKAIESNRYLHSSNMKVEREEVYLPICGIGEYMEQASFYRIDMEKGREDMAKERLLKMQQTKQDMGDLAMYAEEIDEMLGIEVYYE